MDTLVEIEEAIQRLPQNQIFELVERLERKADDSWDKQFEHDVQSGKLNDIGNQALREYRAGKSKPFPEDGK